MGQKELPFNDVIGMRAIILAAGRGSRMGDLTDEKPKCLLEVYGKPLIEHQIECEMEMRNLTDNEIEEYVALDKPLESCGAYKFEANGFKLFKSVIGSLEAINGIPFADLKELIDAKI